MAAVVGGDITGRVIIHPNQTGVESRKNQKMLFRKGRIKVSYYCIESRESRRNIDSYSLRAKRLLVLRKGNIRSRSQKVPKRKNGRDSSIHRGRKVG